MDLIDIALSMSELNKIVSVKVQLTKIDFIKTELNKIYINEIVK